MSGHNKWSKIKHKKAASDAKKSNVYSKLLRMVTMEAKAAGGDTTSPGLRTAIEKARKENVPKDNIDRAVQKALDKDAASLEKVQYEAYGPGGCALVIIALTDNRNRTAAEVRHILSKNSTELAQPGSASWCFTESEGTLIPTQTVALSEADGEKLGALIDTLDENNDVQEVFTNAE